MELELLMRREGAIPKEVNDEIHDAKLIDENFDVDEYLKEHNLYVYDPITFDMAQGMIYTMSDEHHTVIHLDTGISFTAKLPYKQFQAIRNAMLGTKNKTLDDFKIM